MPASLTRWLTNYDSQASMGSKLRARRIKPLLAMIDTTFRERGAVNLIDIGGTERYWGIMPEGYLDAKKVNITIINLPGENISSDQGRFKFLEGDACDLKEFEDQSFDIAHSNSVVEHVGDWRRMVRFASEMTRVARSCFVQTPNYWFPVEPHCMTPFFHWLPKPTRVWLVSRFQLGQWDKASSVSHAVEIVDSARLLNKKMLAALFQGAEISTERIFGLPKSHIAIRMSVRSPAHATR